MDEGQRIYGVSGGLFQPSGGARYHWHAWRRRKLWQPFRRSVQDWLENWNPPHAELVLIGPSGGYSLPTSWLKRFSKITAYDIDPLAAWMFSRRHPQVVVDFERQDVFWENARLSTTHLAQILREHVSATILFCNVIGQIPLEGQVSDSEFLNYLGQIRALMNGHVWASYHDLLTLEPLALERHERVREAYIQSDGKDLKPALRDLAQIEIVDHLTSGMWTAGLERRILGWSLTATSLHLIEAVNS